MKNFIFIFLLFPGIIELSGQSGNKKVLEDLEQIQSNVQDNNTTATITRSTRLFGSKDDLTTVLVIIPSGSVVTVLGADSTYLHVSFEENEGFIFRKHASINQKNTQSQQNQDIQRNQQQNQYNHQNQYNQQNQNQNQNELQNRQRQEYQQSQPGGQNQYQQSRNELQNRQRQDYQQSQQGGQNQYQHNPQDGQDQQMSRFSYLENKYGTNMASRMMTGKIWKGMNPEMVRDTWGKAMKVNRVINGNTIKEEWIYNNTWLYFENNELVEWGPAKR